MKNHSQGFYCLFEQSGFHANHFPDLTYTKSRSQHNHIQVFLSEIKICHKLSTFLLKISQTFYDTNFQIRNYFL